MAIEKSNEVFRHKLDKLVQVYENDKELTEMLKFYNIYIPDVDENIPSPERILQYEQILTVFENNSTEISDKTITELLTVSSIRSEIDTLIYQSTEPITDEMYRQFLYSYKYGTIKHFFTVNHTLFTPGYDSQIIQSNEKMKIWQEAFMREFDRFAAVIDDIIEIQDIDIIAEEYLDYIAQLVGFERGDTSLGDSLFREITKNIIEVYRIKGTNYSFELFFNFIGFEIDVIEYWFDKRFFMIPGLGKNPYTKETSRFKFGYYLTPVKPTEGYPNNLPSPFILNRDDITSIRNGLTFDKKLGNNSLSELKKMLWIDQEGEPDKEDENLYTYFKTNVIEYSIKKMTDSEVDEGLSDEDAKTIESYVRFLTPIFVDSNIVVNIQPFEDDASLVLNMSDDNLLINNISTSMFVSLIAGTILYRLGMDINGIETEYWNWDLYHMDEVYQFGDIFADSNLSNLQPPSLYGDLESLNAYDDSNLGEIISSSSPLHINDNLFSDIFKVSVPVEYQYQQNGRIKLSGKTVPYSQFLGEGGVEISGSHNLSFHVKYLSSYEIKMKGSAIQKAGKTTTMNGGIKAKGSVIPYSQFLGKGKIFISGSVNLSSASLKYNAIGNINIKGNTRAVLSYKHNPSGIININGKASYNQVFYGFGGIVLSGSGVSKSVLKHSSSGTIYTGGTSSSYLELSYAPSGEIITSGTSNLKVDVRYITSGTVVTSGTATSSQS